MSTDVATTPDLISGFALLREPFPDGVVGKLPRATCKDCRDSHSKVCDKHTKRQCDECGNYMTSAHIHLDYVGHAAVTDRLLRVDPFWTWEPMAWTTEGLPLIRDGALWLRLTVLGVTRPGVGSADGKSGADATKEMIGDGLRNAAMRFGVALDLWSKEDLHAQAPEPLAEPDVVAALVDRMNALPAEARKQVKSQFVATFGKPETLRAASVNKADDLIADFEKTTEVDQDSPPDGAGVTDALVGDPEHAPNGGDDTEGSRPNDVPSPPDGPPITDPQVKALNTALHNNGIAGPARLTKLTQMLGRDIDSTKSLTKAEATWAIDELGFDKTGDAA